MPYTACAHSGTGLCESPKECHEFKTCLNDQPPAIAMSGGFDGSGAAMPAAASPFCVSAGTKCLTSVACKEKGCLHEREPAAAAAPFCLVPPCPTPSLCITAGCAMQPAVNPKDAAGSKKLALGLLPAAGKIEGAKACANGAAKYGPYNWRDIPITYSVYLDAIERHLLALRDGEDIAADSKVHHLGHIIAGASIALDALYLGVLKDDRPKVKGPAAELLKV